MKIQLVEHFNSTFAFNSSFLYNKAISVYEKRAMDLFEKFS